MLKASHIKLLKKIGMIFLATLLCFILVVNTCIDSYAVAGVDDALFWLLCAICSACGISFGTTALAQAGTSALYDNMDSDTQSMVDNIASQIQTKVAFDGAVGLIGAGFVMDYWASILDAIALTFGTYVGVDTAINLTSAFADRLPLLSSDNSVLSYDCSWSPNSVTQYIIGNVTITYIGANTGYVLPDYLLADYDFDTDGTNTQAVLGTLSIADGTFYQAFARQSGSYATWSGTQTLGFYGTSSNLGINNISILNTSYAYFLGQALDITMTDDIVTLMCNDVNIVQGGYLMGTDIAVPGSICPDGVFGLDGWREWIDDLCFGSGAGALPGNPSIDAPSMPGNDTWHDGSINDDIAVGSPSIGIAVPTSSDDVIDLSPDVARDYTSTGTRVGDIASSDTTTGDTTGDSTGTGNTTSSNPSNTLPGLSLPEILFKEKFPFCLPWDLYTLFNVLKAEPEVPKFVIPFKIERFGVDESITIDLSQFEEQIEIVRFFIGATFVLGLILVSRKMIGAD